MNLKVLHNKSLEKVAAGNFKNGAKAFGRGMIIPFNNAKHAIFYKKFIYNIIKADCENSGRKFSELSDDELKKAYDFYKRAIPRSEIALESSGEFAGATILATGAAAVGATATVAAEVGTFLYFILH